MSSHQAASALRTAGGGGLRSSAALPIALRIPASPGSGRGPRRHQRSSSRARARKLALSCPHLAKGCLSNASSGTGAKPFSAASASRHRKAPAVVWASGRPAESSISTPQRRISAATRRARLRSGVTSAALRPGVSSASRSASAMASASCAGSAAVTSAISFRPCAISSLPFCVSARQASVVGAGRSVSRSSCSRAGLGAAANQSFTSPRSVFMLRSNSRKPYCG